MMHSLVHPSAFLPLAAWGLLAGMVLGMANDAGRMGRMPGGLLVLGSLAALFAFAAGGDVRGAVDRLKAEPSTVWPAAAGVAGALAGLYLAFGSHAGRARRAAGVALVLGAAGLVFLKGVPGSVHSFEGLPTALSEHGAAFMLGVFLLYWAGWCIHRQVETRFGK